MGVLNVTPDSFSDGGKYFAIDDALARAEQLVNEGADILDIGGESSRPGAGQVDAKEEIRRTLPVMQEIVKCFSVSLSIDTRKFEVAELAVEAGATIINDISGGEDPRMGQLLKKENVRMVLMHMKGTPETMQQNPNYQQDVVLEVKAFLQQRVNAYLEMGIEREKLWVDPGIGFGKTLSHNLALLNRLDEFAGVGGRLVIGTSRKSFLGQVVSESSAKMELRQPGTLASNLWAYTKGASVFRVHEVGEFKRALQTWQAICKLKE